MRTEMRMDLEAAIDQGVSEESLASTKKKMADLFDEFHADFENRVKDYLGYNIAAWAQDMADKAVEALLRGDVEEMKRRLRCVDNQWTGRDRDHWVIRGKLSEHDPILLRKQIVDAFPELLKDQRILDLEDQVRSLVETIAKAEQREQARYSAPEASDE